MFNQNGAFSSFSVHDTEKARAFYEDLLQLKVVVKDYMMEVTVPGAGTLMLYPKPDHEPATYTVLNFKVSNIEEAVKQLKDMGIKFESYDLPGMKTDANNIFSVKEMNIRQAWFTDPSGNIISVIEG